METAIQAPSDLSLEAVDDFWQTHPDIIGDRPVYEVVIDNSLGERNEAMDLSCSRINNAPILGAVVLASENLGAAARLGAGTAVLREWHKDYRDGKLARASTEPFKDLEENNPILEHPVVKYLMSQELADEGGKIDQLADKVLADAINGALLAQAIEARNEFNTAVLMALIGSTAVRNHVMKNVRDAGEKESLNVDAQKLGKRKIWALVPAQFLMIVGKTGGLPNRLGLGLMVVSNGLGWAAIPEMHSHLRRQRKERRSNNMNRFYRALHHKKPLPVSIIEAEPERSSDEVSLIDRVFLS